MTGAMLTNFHLPKTSLLLLVCAFAGKDFALGAYRHAVRQGYRFYSYGDCMLIGWSSGAGLNPGWYPARRLVTDASLVGIQPGAVSERILFGDSTSSAHCVWF